MTVQSRVRAFVKTIVVQPWPSSVTRTAPLSNAFRALMFGRGCRKRFGVSPTIRQVRNLFTTHPLITNSFTYGCLFVGAELCQQLFRLSSSNSAKSSQRISVQSLHLDLGALKRYAFWGTLIIPPIYYKWYKWLDGAYLTSNNGPLNKKILLQKLFLDQFLLTPVILAMFFVGMALMECQEDAVDECRRKFVPTFLVDCMFWLPIQAFNFRFVPQDMRVAFLAVATFVWVNVLCFIKSLPTESFSTKASDEE